MCVICLGITWADQVARDFRPCQPRHPTLPNPLVTLSALLLQNTGKDLQQLPECPISLGQHYTSDFTLRKPSCRESFISLSQPPRSNLVGAQDWRKWLPEQLL